MTVDRSRLPLSGPEPPFAFPAIRRRRLANGLRRLDGRAPRRARSLSVLVLVRARRRRRPGRPPRARGASPATCSTKASGDLDALALHEALGRLGAQLDTDVGSDATLRRPDRRSSGPRRRRSALLADMITRPAARRRATSSACASCACNRLLQLRDMPPAVADRVFTRAARTAAHPYGHLPIGTEASLRSMDADEPRAFHRGCTARRARRSSPSANGSHEALGDARRRGVRRLAGRAPGGRSRADPAALPMPPGSRRAAHRAAARRAAVGAAHRPRRGGQALDATTTRSWRSTWCSAASSSAAST